MSTLDKIKATIENTLSPKYSPSILKGFPCRRAIWYAYYHYPTNSIPWKYALEHYIKENIYKSIHNILKQGSYNLDYMYWVILNNSDYTKLQKYKCRSAHETTYKQIQIKMHEQNKLTMTLMAINSDNYDIYEEVIPYHKNYATMQMDRYKSIIEQSECPERIRNQKTYYLCKQCIYKEVCYDQNARIT